MLLIPAQMGAWESYKKVLLPLSADFRVYALDIRGHGKSSWTPGRYSWRIIGKDLEHFIENVVQRKVIVGGNSSGGILALWCAANLGERVSGIIIEDAPIFSAEMPRFKERDRFVYDGLKNLVDRIGDVENRDLAEYFRDLQMPVSQKRIKQMPNWVVDWLSRKIARFQAANPGMPVEVGWPDALRVFIKSLSMFDPDFAHAFVDGRFYDGIDHSRALRETKCPILLLHADWARYDDHGLVGAMDDDDARRVLELTPQTEYVRVSANHVIHAFQPKRYVELVKSFGNTLAVR